MEEKMILKDISNDTEYIFTIINEGSNLRFILTENDEKCPFIFENTFELDDFIEHHKAFRSCDDIEQIEHHFNVLYKKEKLTVYNIGSEQERQIEALIGNISEETKSKEFVLSRKLKYTDEDVLEFYKIYKKDKVLKGKIKTKIEKGLEKENPLRKDILSLFEQNA